MAPGNGATGLLAGSGSLLKGRVASRRAGAGFWWTSGTAEDRQDCGKGLAYVAHLLDGVVSAQIGGGGTGGRASGREPRTHDWGLWSSGFRSCGQGATCRAGWSRDGGWLSSIVRSSSRLTSAMCVNWRISSLSWEPSIPAPGTA